VSKIAQKFSILVTEFKASYGQVQWFLNRQQLLILRTAVSQTVPEQYEEKLIHFRKSVILLRKKPSFPDWKH
jgi:hypothetical protein